MFHTVVRSWKFVQCIARLIILQQNTAFLLPVFYNRTIMKYKLPKYLLYIAWTQAFIAMAGSLFFSEVMKFPPCVLCWYQRICMYPLVVILTVGILRGDKKVYLYVLPLSISGLIIAIY